MFRAECASVRQEQQAVLTEAGKKQALFLAENRLVYLIIIRANLELLFFIT